MPLSTPPDTPVKNKMELDNPPNGGAEEGLSWRNNFY
jgi:hypothetical protein